LPDKECELSFNTFLLLFLKMFPGMFAQQHAEDAVQANLNIAGRGVLAFLSMILE
jgi:hypothetical protein